MLQNAKKILIVTIIILAIYNITQLFSVSSQSNNAHDLSLSPIHENLCLIFHRDFDCIDVAFSLRDFTTRFLEKFEGIEVISLNEEMNPDCMARKFAREDMVDHFNVVRYADLELYLTSVQCGVIIKYDGFVDAEVAITALEDTKFEDYTMVSTFGDELLRVFIVPGGLSIHYENIMEFSHLPDVKKQLYDRSMEKDQYFRYSIAKALLGGEERLKTSRHNCKDKDGYEGFFPDITLELALNPPFETCAVLGGAGILAGSSFGSEIDAHEQIII
eukprot:TRINITY_DN2837_c0_g1_i1.p1 TRINITY_DN2837_c0_g1~~TRINITY_DN2837_c0_g1_i1.p1  ORF type:complete len:274 (-),score=55.08 TRINITY_DN2837_c0_g1_i1:542-1363(-)